MSDAAEIYRKEQMACQKNGHKFKVVDSQCGYTVVRCQRCGAEKTNISYK